MPNSGWPINRQDLDPYYARANEKLKLGPYNYDLAFWQQQKPNLNPLPLDENVVWHKMWQLSEAAGFKGGMIKWYKDPIVKARNVHLYTHATVVDILGSENASQVKELKVKNLVGKNHTIKAKHYILAGGAIQNARMLLASNTQSPKGIGNDNDLVGRYFHGASGNKHSRTLVIETLSNRPF